MISAYASESAADRIHGNPLSVSVGFRCKRVRAGYAAAITLAIRSDETSVRSGAKELAFDRGMECEWSRLSTGSIQVPNYSIPLLLKLANSLGARQGWG